MFVGIFLCLGNTDREGKHIKILSQNIHIFINCTMSFFLLNPYINGERKISSRKDSGWRWQSIEWCKLIFGGIRLYLKRWAPRTNISIYIFLRIHRQLKLKSIRLPKKNGCRFGLFGRECSIVNGTIHPVSQVDSLRSWYERTCD